MQDKAAIRRLKRGYLDGLAHLIEQYQVQAVRTAMLITRDRGMAEDVVQSAFVGLMRSLSSYNDERPFAPWFLRIVARDALRAARAASMAEALPEDWDEGNAALPDVSPLIEDLIEARELRAAIGLALQRLPAEQRALVVLRYYLDASENEMAEFFSIPAGTVKWRLHTARHQLRALLHPDWKGVADG